MLVSFIAHAGFAVSEGDYSILIDPWFTDSTLENPILEGLVGVRTIDFQIPKTKDGVNNYSPHAILISHFHAHHSPKRDILGLISRTPHDIILAFPAEVSDKFVSEAVRAYPHVSLNPVKGGASFNCGPFTITALAHTVDDHLAWSIKSSTGHILHIADARANLLAKLNDLDPIWDTFLDLQPDAVFLSAGRNNLRREHENKRILIENTTLSPIQAARLVARIKPKVVSSIGTQNHSIWKNTIEFIPETSLNEEEFRWALDWLSPETKFISIRPGHIFSIGESSNPNNKADTYI